jgi:Tol biopolymer transport system component/DNA-binding winged helix-turn-helix (wHTH) protein
LETPCSIAQEDSQITDASPITVRNEATKSRERPTRNYDFSMMDTIPERNSLIFRFDRFEVDPASFRLLRDGIAVSIEPKALELLIFMLRNRGRLLTKQELLEAVWRNSSVTENALAREIALLRRVLGDSIKEPKYITTVPTRGYRFVAEVSEAAEEQSGSEQPAPNMTADPLAASNPQTGRALGRIIVIAVVVLLFLASTLSFRLFRRHQARLLANSREQIEVDQLTESNGLDVFPGFSPDGRSIAYSSDRTGAFEIYLRQLGPDGGEVQLTHDGGNMEPAWSPDGQRIAYHSAKAGGIWIIPAFGGTPRRLADFGSHPAWSHDSGTIAFASGTIGAVTETELGTTPDSTIWTVNVHDGNLSQLTHRTSNTLQTFGDSSPQWSPDNRRILFATNGRIWTVDASGNDARLVLPDRFAYDPVFSNDGQRIYFLSLDAEGSSIWEVPVNQAGAETGRAMKVYSAGPGTVKYLTSSGPNLAFSVVNTQDNLYSVRLSSNGKSGAPFALTHDTRLRKTRPVFSPDSSMIAFLVTQKGQDGQVWTVSINGSNAQKLPGDVPAFDPDWCNADSLCYWTYDNRNVAHLWRWNARTKGLEDVFQTNERMSAIQMSPDGQFAAYQRTDNGQVNVWTLSLSDGHARQLSFQPDVKGFPVWSHDGKFLAVEVVDGVNTQIAVIPKAGGPLVSLTHHAGQNWPASWSTDGKEVAFAGFRDGIWNVFTVSRDSGKERQLTHYTHANTFVRYPDWSPDGRNVVYEYGTSTANVWLLKLAKK